MHAWTNKWSAVHPTADWCTLQPCFACDSRLHACRTRAGVPDASHKPFEDAVTITGLKDEVEVLKSLQAPKKARRPPRGRAAERAAEVCCDARASRKAAPPCSAPSACFANGCFRSAVSLQRWVPGEDPLLHNKGRVGWVMVGAEVGSHHAARAQRGGPP